MADILHRVGINATPEEVFEALTTIDGLLIGGSQILRAIPNTDLIN
jgi:hypothetical protein